MKKRKNAISPTRNENFAEWYQQIIRASDMAENSETRGCMTIKPWGYAIWEHIQIILDKKLKESGHQNAYFPLLIPLSHLEKEADHAEGFSTECAVVTHTRLKAIQENGKTQLIPDGELKEPYIIRPTSETIVGNAFAKWIQSYRDLPLLINQWANVFRWEMRPRLFLRTSEFLWQEGHTVHESEKEAKKETQLIQNIYHQFLDEVLAIYSVRGKKTEREKFPGAEETLTVEVMVQNNKAVQAGTSHYLGQNFAKAQNIQFTNREGELKFGFTTSWGVSTRLIGTLIMTHSDDDGLRLPPMISPQQVVIIPIIKEEKETEKVLHFCDSIRQKMNKSLFQGQAIRILTDKREIGFSHKKWEWIKKGVPLLIEIGKREIESGQFQIMSRLSQKEDNSQIYSKEELEEIIPSLLENYQSLLKEKSQNLCQSHLQICQDKEEFETHWKKEKANWLLVPWEGTRDQEEFWAKKFQISIRCIPEKSALNLNFPETAKCILTGKETKQWAIWANSY